MALVEIPYTPRYPEIHTILEAHRFTVLVAHRRFGKTVLSINHLLKQALLCKRERGSFAYVAPQRNQAKIVVWGMLKHYSDPVPMRKINEGELSIQLPNGATIRIFGADNPDALRGLYFDGVILDEVAQMKAEVWGEIIQPALADRQGWALFIGTPKGVNLFSELYYDALERMKRGDNTWAALSYPVTETTALPAEEVERLRSELSDNAFRQEMLCDFNASSDDVLITLDEVRTAQHRDVDLQVYAAWPVIIGVDVARFGDDATVFQARRGLYAFDPIVIRQLTNTEVAHRLVAYIQEIKPAAVCIDQGQGTGVIDLVRELVSKTQTSVLEIPFGSAATNDDLYVNRRAEMWVRLRDWLRDGGKIPVNTILEGDLTAPTYEYDSRGRIKLEKKDLIKERLRRSTDLGDALALTFAVQLGPDRDSIFPEWEGKYGHETAQKMRDYLYDREGSRNTSEWNPFEGQDNDAYLR